MSSPIRHELEEYVAGRSTAERLVTAVAGVYYREAGGGKREALQPAIDLIERAAPGLVELARIDSGPGFAVRLAERSFPAQYESDLRRVAEQALEHLPADTLPASRFSPPVPPTLPASPVPPRGLFRRIIGAIQRIFSA